jgi:hypothetical protein
MMGQVIADPSLDLLSLCGVVPQVPILVRDRMRQFGKRGGSLVWKDGKSDVASRYLQGGSPCLGRLRSDP